MPGIEIFPLDHHNNRHCQNRISPERGDKNKRGEGHEVTPVIYSAGITALIPYYPLKNAPDWYTKLVHEDKKNYSQDDPHTIKHPGMEKDTNKKYGK